MKLIFTGDINFRGFELLDFASCAEILSEVKPYFENVDFRVVNLETPLADKAKHAPIYKSGPNLISSPENIVFLKALGADIATLANNHTGDYGEGAMHETLRVLSQNGIRYCGAGKNIEKAYEACRVEKDGISLSILSVCENEFGGASEKTGGAACYNMKILFRKIRQEKQASHFVIVVFHGGNEFNPLPSPDTQDRYRLLCDMGADAVIAGHTHCPQGYELYDGKPIIYSMGNFFFQSSTVRDANNSWYYGYLPELTVEDYGISVRTIPYALDPGTGKIRVFTGEKREKMLRYIERISDIIRDSEQLEKYFWGWVYLHKWLPQAPADYSNLQEYCRAGNFNLLCCESHCSQAKKVLELCFLDRIGEAGEWAEKIKELFIMPAANNDNEHE